MQALRPGELAIPLALIFLILSVGPAMAQVPACPDSDEDGYADCTVNGCDPGALACGDCDDSDPERHPGATEICNHRDDNCDGRVDDGFTSINSTRRLLDTYGKELDALGTSLAPVGDLNGDGIGDILAGSPWMGSGPVPDGDPHIGGGVVVFSGLDGSVVRRVGVPYSSTDLGTGVSVADIGDINGDGVTDFASGSTRAIDYETDSRGIVYLFSGVDGSTIGRCFSTKAQSPSKIGETVLGVGDVNLDGVPDILVGAPNYVGEEWDMGGAVLFSGRVPLSGNCSEIAWLHDPEPDAHAQMGAALAGLGDISHGGVQDFAIGAPWDNRGAVSIYSGRTRSRIEKIVNPDQESSTQFGWALAGGSDLDDDGIQDLIVGVPGDPPTEPSQGIGSIQVYSGSDWRLLRKIANPYTRRSYMGHAVATIGDINGDGVDEIVTVVRYYDVNNLAGSFADVVVLSGADGTILRTMHNPGTLDDGFGHAITAVPDTDGDGQDEVVVSSYEGSTPWGNDVGFLTVYSLEADCDDDGSGSFAGDCDDTDPDIGFGFQEICDSLDNDCNLLIDDDSDGDGIGVCDDCDDMNPLIHPAAVERCNGIDDDCDGGIDEGADLDGDGVALPCDCDDTDEQVFPGASETCNYIDQDCDGASDNGFAEVITLVRTVPPETHVRYRPDLDWYVVGVGDVSMDGIDDYAVVDPPENQVNIHSGSDRSVLCNLAPTEYLDRSQFGAAITGISDISGDGVPDLAVGSPYDRNPASYQTAGAVCLFSGADCTLLGRLVDPDGRNTDALGVSVTTIPDLTGDDIPEIVAGAPGWRSANTISTGQAVVFDTATGSVLARLRDPHGKNEAVGRMVQTAGDLDHDGVDDILVSTKSGSLFSNILVFSGDDFRFIRRIFQEYISVFADAVVLGDVTGDGIDDIAVGDPLDNFISIDAGAVRILSGADGELARFYTDPEGVKDERLGQSLDLVSDMDGDGIREILAGAPSKADQRYALGPGKVVIFSGMTGEILFRYSLSPADRNRGFGYSVAGLKDRNRPGNPVIIANAPGEDEGEVEHAGAVYWLTPESDCDEDGYGSLGNDCDESDPAANPGVADLCDGIYQNDCIPGDGTAEPWYGIPCDGVDSDLCVEGSQTCAEGLQLCGDFTDNTPEICSGFDDDCDGTADNILCSDFDINTDQRIDAEELSWIGRAFSLCSGDPAAEWWYPVDHNEDGCVDGEDLAVLANVWGKTCQADVLTCD